MRESANFTQLEGDYHHYFLILSAGVGRGGCSEHVFQKGGIATRIARPCTPVDPCDIALRPSFA